MTRNKSDRPKGYVDYTLIFILILLLGFGLVMVYSTSSYSASISKASNNDPNFYLRKQAIATVFGAIAMAGMAIILGEVWRTGLPCCRYSRFTCTYSSRNGT